MLTKALLAGCIAIVTLPALAQSNSQLRQQQIDQRQANQAQRIAQGQATGQLTPQEAARLKREQARIARMEARARADGRISSQEAARIKRAQDNASRHIHHERNDRQRLR